MTNQDILEENVLLDIEKMDKKLDKVLNDKFIETLLFLGGIAYLLLLIENIILASFFGYNILTNYISELGNSSIIPFPFLNDVITIFCGTIMFFSHFYYVRELKIKYHLSSFSKVFLKLGFLSGIIGAVGYFFLGIFSLDRAGPSELYHGICMGFSFSGFLFSIAFYSLTFVFTHKCNLKKLGLYGLTFPLICFIVYSPTNNPLTEWILLFSIIAFFLVFAYHIFR
ncbi:MAG: hypothetical protein MUP85_11270 [Candidatus Lokiarchaeota archaeon]|nr:hypothetical protein [Candidatus Lokiarchaeota archaeon]